MSTKKCIVCDDFDISIINDPHHRKSKAVFDKYCAPLLHLAGIKVAVVRTEHEGQARDLMAIMEKTSAVVVAGGDGTLAEVLACDVVYRPELFFLCPVPIFFFFLWHQPIAPAGLWSWDWDGRHLSLRLCCVEGAAGRSPACCWHR